MAAISFTPLYMERVWGGRELANHYHRPLPSAAPFGEAWEIVDREEAQSIVANGPHEGKSLHELWTQHREEIFGSGYERHDRFPILIKILDARHDLSIQVHPPAHLAPSLGGEPKTEMWYIAAADPGAKLYVGLKNGITREQFEAAIRNGNVDTCVHAIQPQPGDSIFIPSGRLHAIGAGFLIHEIQQNSDTTYRVFDWNRLGLDGKPRELHIAPSLASIDFADFEPSMDSPVGNTLATCPFFHTERIAIPAGSSISNPQANRFSLVTVASGSLRDLDETTYPMGTTVLLPVGSTPLTATADTTALRITLPA